jgi:hypothetical protein
VFKLSDSPLLDTDAKLAHAAYMLLKRWACFSFDGSYGRTTLLKHSIVTEPDQRPINQRFRPVNPHLEVDLKKQIDKWLKHGVIEKSCSPWNFGLVAAPKKGGAIHWAGLKLQPAKCQLFQREIEYLGHMVSAKGIAPVPGYVQVVKDWPMPTNWSEVRTFLGKTGYY